MSKLDLAYDLVNYTPASASPVEANFDRVEQHVNQEVIERDGSVAMRAQLKLVGDPVNVLDAAPKQYVDQVLPLGIIMMFGGAGVPPGGRWALCNGAEMATAAYPELFAIIGNAFSPAGTPAGRFNLPNLNGRFPVGAGTDALGATGGSRDAVVPTHTHPIDHNHGAAFASTGATVDHTHYDDHRHGINLTTGTESVQHTHAMRGSADASSGTGLGEKNIADASLGSFPVTANTAAESAAHVHGVDGYSGYKPDPRSGGATDHAHMVTVPTMTGASGAAGVAPTNANMPPFVAVQYILRVS